MPLTFPWFRSLLTFRGAPGRRERPRRPLTLERLEARETPSASPGTITTVAGDPPPALPSPFAVAVDASGNLFVVDGSNRIREVHAGTGAVTTVAGDGVQGYNGDNIPAVSAELDDPSAVAVDSAGDLFIAEDLDNRIREVNHATGRITTVAGNGFQGTTGGTLTSAGATSCRLKARPRSLSASSATGFRLTTTATTSPPPAPS